MSGVRTLTEMGISKNALIFICPGFFSLIVTLSNLTKKNMKSWSKRFYSVGSGFLEEGSETLNIGEQKGYNV